MEIPTAQTLVLGRGEARQLRIARGITILVLAGRIRVHGPLLWLAETPWRDCQCLATEQALTIERSGWMEIQAEAGARVVLIPPQPIPGRQRGATFATRVRAFLARWLRTDRLPLPR